jgi:hypothetical protein
MLVSRESNLDVTHGDLKLRSPLVYESQVGFPTIALRTGEAGTDEGVVSEPLS